MRDISLVSRLLLLASQSGQLKKWSTRSRGNSFFDQLKASVKRLLTIISGNDICAMLRDVLTLKERDHFQYTKIADAMRNIGAEVNKSTPKTRHTFIRSLKDAGVSRRNAFKAGFKPSSHLW